MKALELWQRFDYRTTNDEYRTLFVQCPLCKGVALKLWDDPCGRAVGQCLSNNCEWREIAERIGLYAEDEEEYFSDDNSEW